MKYLTTKQVAEKLGVTEQRVRQLAHSRGIGYQRPDQRWIFRELDLVKFQERKVGRPKTA